MLESLPQEVLWQVRSCLSPFGAVCLPESWILRCRAFARVIWLREEDRVPRALVHDNCSVLPCALPVALGVPLMSDSCAKSDRALLYTLVPRFAS